jgi:phospho-N-acetylmuramoyl-pentapeptide-transferase
VSHVRQGLVFSTQALIMWAGILVMALMGFLDDYIKVAKQRSLGLRSKAKMAGQTIVAVGFAWLAVTRPDSRGETPASTAISFTREMEQWTLPAVLFVVLAFVMITGSSNAVNLTDGLDGLATGASTMVFGAYTLVNIWQNNQSCVISPGPKCYEVRDPLDLAVIAAALTGACFGFLWWNASPAKIIMGDTGSLALGGALAGLAILTRTEFLLAILGGLFVIITMSVMLQVGYFKLSGGKRIFRMAPLQHHFELKGWAEITIVIRFWIITGLCVATGLGVFYAEWVTGS